MRLVLLSGGMDSATALADSINVLGQTFVEAVAFDYGQRHVKEILAAVEITNYYGVKLTALDLRGASEAFRGSALTGGGDVPEGHYEEPSMKQTVVPNRNMIMLSLAAGLAISRGIETVVYAAHSGDHAIYPDCRPSFVKAVDEAIKEGNWYGPKILAPFINISKADIAKIGAKLKVPYQKTWSCYKGGAKHCGRCGTCVERVEAFKLAGVEDPTEYMQYVGDKFVVDGEVKATELVNGEAVVEPFNRGRIGGVK